jgi:outer membrane protein
MKNALLVINVFLVIAVGTLFFLYFKKKAPQLSAAVINDTGRSAKPDNFRIAYFEMDSIENNYILSKIARERVREKEEALKRESQGLIDKYNKLWDESLQIQQSLSDNEKMKRQQDLEGLKEAWQTKQQVQNVEVQNEILKYRQKIYLELQEFLKKYSVEKGFAFVLASDSDGTINDPLYYKDAMYDITRDVVNGLNEAYKAKNK